MLFLHEVHEVIGRREDEFEAAVRDEWLPALAATDDARLLYFLHHAHGAGLSYNVVSLTAIRDGAAWERVVRRVDGGDLAKRAERLDGLRHDVTAKILVPLPWSPLQDVDFDAVPVTPERHEPTLFMEDTVWPYEGRLEDIEYTDVKVLARAMVKGFLEGEIDEARIFYTRFVSTKATGGTGLGMVVVKKIIDEHGGEIDVESAPEEGTTFHIHLQRLPENESGEVADGLRGEKEGTG